MPQAARAFRVESIEAASPPRTAKAGEELHIPAQDGRWLAATHFAGSAERIRLSLRPYQHVAKADPPRAPGRA